MSLRMARIMSSRMTSASIMAASKLLNFFYFNLLFDILKTPFRILSMQADERPASLKTRFSGSVCRPSLTIVKHLIEDFIGPARLLILWLEIFGKKNLEKKIRKKNYFFFLLILSLHNETVFR